MILLVQDTTYSLLFGPDCREQILTSAAAPQQLYSNKVG